MSNDKAWRCEVCGSIVIGIVWKKAINGLQQHTAPDGKDCRAVKFESVIAEPGATLVTSRDIDDTAEHVPLCAPYKPST